MSKCNPRLVHPIFKYRIFSSVPEICPREVYSLSSGYLSACRDIPARNISGTRDKLFLLRTNSVALGHDKSSLFTCQLCLCQMIQRHWHGLQICSVISKSILQTTKQTINWKKRKKSRKCKTVHFLFLFFVLFKWLCL